MDWMHSWKAEGWGSSFGSSSPAPHPIQFPSSQQILYSTFNGKIFHLFLFRHVRLSIGYMVTMKYPGQEQYLCSQICYVTGERLIGIERLTWADPYTPRKCRHSVKTVRMCRIFYDFIFSKELLVLNIPKYRVCVPWTDFWKQWRPVALSRIDLLDWVFPFRFFKW